MKITAQVLEDFKIRSNGGMFYRQDTALEWILCNDSWARDKISHALRFQMKTPISKPKLQRHGSVPTAPKNVHMSKKVTTRPRSGSYDSCPAVIVTCPTSEVIIDNQVEIKDFHSVPSDSDPLLLFDEMITTGEWEKLYEPNIVPSECSFTTEPTSTVSVSDIDDDQSISIGFSDTDSISDIMNLFDDDLSQIFLGCE